MVSDGSGWTFQKIVFYDVRISRTLPANFVRFGARGTPTCITFHPLLQSTFRHNVIDPTKYLQSGYSRENCCVPCCVILSLHFKFGPPLRHQARGMIEMMRKIELLPFSSLLEPTQTGLSLTQLSRLEDLLKPIPAQLIREWPGLKFFDGFAINCYTILRKEADFRIFPTSLSRFSRESSFLQVDILIENADIKSPETRNDQKDPQILHTLAVKNLSYLIKNFSSNSYVNRNFYHLCRTCLRVFQSAHLLRNHYETCLEMKRGVLGRRRVLNQLIHKPFRKNRFTGKMERNGLRFVRKNVGRMLKPLAFHVADFESFHEKIDESRVNDSTFENAPKSGLTVQTPMAFAWCHKSNYSQHPLPSSLALPRSVFLDDRQEDPEKEFYLSIFLNMRKDLVLYSNWIESILDLDQGPPAQRFRRLEEIIYFRTRKYCQLCGATFGAKKWSQRSQSYYFVKRSWDHCHFMTNAGGLRAVLCCGCNLSYSTEKAPPFMFYVCHNASRYDNLCFLRGLLDWAVKERITYPAHDGTSYTRNLLVGPPRAIFRSENEVLSLTWKYSCPFERCHCKLSGKEKQTLQENNQRLRACPFQRQIRILDSYQFIQAPLDSMISQVHEAGRKENLPLARIFPTTLNFLRSRNLNQRQIDLVIKGKIKMPYESMSSPEDLRKTQCPGPEAFTSELRGTGPLNEEEMKNFETIWRELNIPDMYTLYDWYVQVKKNIFSILLYYFYIYIVKSEKNI